MSPFVRRSSVRHTDRVLARSVLLLVLGVYTASFCGLPDGPDGEIAFQTTRSLARRGSLALGGTPEAEAIVRHARSLPAGGTPVRLERRGADEVAYAWSGVGYTGLGVPFYVVGQVAGWIWQPLSTRHEELGFYGQPSSEYLPHFTVGWRNALFGALTAWLIVLCARRLGVARAQVWLAGLGYALTTYAWPQARSSLPEVQATFFLMLAFNGVLKAREHYDRLERPRRSQLVWSGLGIGLALLTSVETLPACLVLMAATEAVLRGGARRLAAARWAAAEKGGVGRDYLAFVAPIVLCVLVFLATNLLRFGDPLDAGRAVVSGRGSGAGGSGLSLSTLLFSPGKGLLWMAPMLLLLPWGVRRAMRGGERLWLLVTLGITLSLGLSRWLLGPAPGVWAYGPRSLLPALPFLWLGVALALPAVFERRGLGAFAAVLAGMGFLVQVPAVLVDHMTHQDLALQAAPAAWPADNAAGSERPRWEQVHWDWGFAAPWAHWRILRHRVATHSSNATEYEVYPVAEIFRVDVEGVVQPSNERDEMFHHLGWVDQVQRLGGSYWPAALVVGGLLAAGAVLAGRGLDRGVA